MAANFFQKTIIGTAHPSYVAVSAVPLVMDITVVVDMNYDVTVVLGGASGSSTAIWPRGARVELRNVDLSRIMIMAPSGAFVLVIGQAP